MAEQNSKTSQSTSHFQTFKTLLPYLWPQHKPALRIRVVTALVFLVLAKVTSVGIPYLLKSSVDRLNLPANLLLLPLGLILAYGTARIMTQVFGELRDYLFAKVTQNAQRTVGLKTFEHLHALSMAFHLDRQTGGLSRAVERGTHGIQFVLNFMLVNILPTLLEILFVIALLTYQFPASFALIILLTIICYVTYTLIVTNWRVKIRVHMNAKDSEANTKAIDSLLNYETVKYFCNEKHEANRFDKALEGYETAAIKNQQGLSVLNIGQCFIIGIGLVLIMYLAAKGVVNQKLSTGDFVMVNTFLIQLYLPLNFLGFVYRETKQSLVDMEKMFELLHIHAEIQDSATAKPLKITQGEIEFKDVNFSYNPNRQILHRVSFKVKAGKKLAIVGPSGSGKSTISRLLFRFYDPQEGQILIDGQDLRSVTQSSLRQTIGVVPQDTVLFNDTIRYNIRYGRPSASDTEVEEAAQHAKIDHFIQSIPQGYETKVGERGLKLSGGEKQRVAIARTILKNPPLLIFDEATSALDTQTERHIQQSLQELAEHKTTIVIAHRLSTIVDADEVIVLKQGSIIERGTHAELLMQNGEYAQMWARQQEREE